MGNLIIVRALVFRAAVIWLTARLVFAMFDGGRESPAVSTSVAVIVLVVTLSFVDFDRRRERALLANLGLGRFAVLSICAMPAVVAELLVRFACRLAA